MSIKNKIIEKWLPVSEYENIYFISNLGNIKSITRLTKTSDNKIKLIKGVLLKQSKDKDGYSIVSLCKNSKVKIGKIHKLVAEAFVKKPYGGNFTVNHKDLNKDNNCFTNLEWLSNEDNIRHAWDNNRYNKNITPVVTKNKFTNEIIKYRSIYEVSKFTGVSKKILYLQLLIRKNSGQFHTDEVIFKIDDGSPWPIFYNNPKLHYRFIHVFDFITIDSNDNIRIYNSINLAAAHTNVKSNLIKEKFLDNDIFVIGKYIFQLLPLIK